MKTKLENCEGFQWDAGNSEKNWIKHKVTMKECEQVFFNKPIIVADPEKSKSNEKRFYLLGRTDENRKLFVVFTIRKTLVRVISARDMSKKERDIYNEEFKKHTEI